VVSSKQINYPCVTQISTKFGLTLDEQTLSKRTVPVLLPGRLLPCASVSQPVSGCREGGVDRRARRRAHLAEVGDDAACHSVIGGGEAKTLPETVMSRLLA
jgi:hypothetical protein